MKKIILFGLLILLTGCQMRVLEDSLFAYNTLINIKLYEGNEEDLNEVVNIFNKYNEYANYNGEINHNVAYINNHAYNEEVSLELDLYEMLKLGIAMYDYTNGYYNLAIGDASFRWKDAIILEEIIDLSSSLEHIHISDITLNEENKSIRFSDSELKIDLGGMAKGYALMKVKNYLDLKNIGRYLINAGESSIIVGVKNENENYKIGLKDPINPNTIFEIVYEKNQALSVSGDYQNYFDLDNLRYHHLLNAKDLSVSRYYKSITLIGSDAFLLDVLSTAMFSMPYEEAILMAEKAHIKAIFYINSDDIRRVNYEES